MTDYAKIECDFIKRTLAIVDQYERHVYGRVEPDEEYQVTLLLNCLLGLLIYPHHLAQEHNWGEWLTNDLVKDVGEEWGITLEHVRCAGHKPPNKRFKQGRCESCGHQKSEFVAIDKPKLTIRQLVRQMRNAVAHPSFSVSTGQDGSDQITSIAFQDRDRGNKEGELFHVDLPVKTLKTFISKLANVTLEYMQQKQSK